MSYTKLIAGEKFPAITVKSLDDKNITLGQPNDEKKWQMIIVYRGQHCPLCTKYLNLLEKKKAALLQNQIDVVAISADSKAQLSAHLEKLAISYPIYYGLSLEQMQTLGLYISIPRSEQETDHYFAEPGTFVVNQEGNLHVVDLSNNPFIRPDLDSLISGLEWIRNPDNNYPIRGTYQY